MARAAGKEQFVTMQVSPFCPIAGHGNPLQYSCLENPHGQRSLVGYSPWGRKKWDMTGRLSTAETRLGNTGNSAKQEAL